MIEESLIFPQLKVENQQQLFEIIVNKMLEKGYVKKGFFEALCEREKAYPTGLQINGIGFAIPHTDPQHVNETKIAVTTLETPVKFADMTNPNNLFDVELVFVLGTGGQDKHIDMLQNLMELFQNTDQCKELLLLRDKAKIIQMLADSGIE